jgi:hypothetical protein
MGVTYGIKTDECVYIIRFFPYFILAILLIILSLIAPTFAHRPTIVHSCLHLSGPPPPPAPNIDRASSATYPTSQLYSRMATLPSSVHIAAPKKSLSHATSKRQRLIDSAASVELKPHPKVRPIKNPSLPPRDNIDDWFGTLNESATQPRPPPAPNLNHLAKARPLDQRPILQSFSWLPNPGRHFTQSPSSTTRSLSQTLPYDEDLMVTRRGTNQSAHASHMQEKNEAELVLQKKMEEERAKRQQEKLQ